MACDIPPAVRNKALAAGAGAGGALRNEITVLRLADGDGCVLLLRDDAMTRREVRCCWNGRAARRHLGLGAAECGSTELLCTKRGVWSPAGPACNAPGPSVLPGPPGPESSCSGPGDGSSKVTSTCSNVGIIGAESRPPRAG